MTDIDFLPIEYREKYARRESQPWQIVVAALIVVLVIAAAAAQQYRRRAATKDLTAIVSAYDTAANQQTRLATSQQQAKSADAAAELYTYLRHPWPRTQLLSALVGPLPDTITLQQIQIMRETSPGSQNAAQRPPTDPKAEEARLKALDPAERDLAKLSARFDSMQTVVILSGVANDAASLHKYIGDLDAMDIFNKADLDSFNIIDNKAGALLQFRAMLSVQPGYGQPGGPRPDDKKQVAHNETTKP